MTHPSWPDELPQRVLVDGFSRGLDDARSFTEMDAGLDKQRARGIAAEPIACQMEIDGGQFARFQRFWREEIGKGVLPFLIRDQNFDGLPIFDEDGNAILDESGNQILGTYYWLATFGKETPSITGQGGSWYKLAFTLLVQPP